ncbi:MAG: DUF2959 domain-containing protein [Verrucomicrobia bacterium]|nr:DUF2959 domain-containing protein [Verrucomicrobiota bacterium]
MIPRPSPRLPQAAVRWTLGLVIVALCATGCRSSYYAVMESFGKHKRDLLRSALTEASQENQQAATQFQDALAQLQALTGFQGGELETKYNAFKADYDDCAAQAGDVHSRIGKVERVARDLFAEWEKELQQIQRSSLRASSAEKLKATRARYDELHAALTRSAAGMDPVLAQMKDYVLYLKHNLNAQAIGSLKTEMGNIETGIGQLIQSMNHSIRETEKFLSLLEQ